MIFNKNATPNESVNDLEDNIKAEIQFFVSRQKEKMDSKDYLLLIQHLTGAMRLELVQALAKHRFDMKKSKNVELQNSKRKNKTRKSIFGTRDLL